jgi:hypothetical protein
MEAKQRVADARAGSSSRSALARAKGLDPDRPAGLTKVTLAQ